MIKAKNGQVKVFIESFDGNICPLKYNKNKTKRQNRKKWVYLFLVFQPKEYRNA